MIGLTMELLHQLCIRRFPDLPHTVDHSPRHRATLPFLTAARQRHPLRRQFCGQRGADVTFIAHDQKVQ